MPIAGILMDEKGKRPASRKMKMIKDMKSKFAAKANAPTDALNHRRKNPQELPDRVAVALSRKRASRKGV